MSNDRMEPNQLTYIIKTFITDFIIHMELMSIDSSGVTPLLLISVMLKDP